MIVGFTGTQSGCTPHQRLKLRELLVRLAPVSELHHGDCIGADAECHAIALELGIPVFLHPCNLVGKRAFSVGAAGEYEPKQPLVRNRDIVHVVDVLIATPRRMHEEMRSGTWATVRYARKAHKKRYVIFPKPIELV
jgi:hypothetical protein